MLLSLTPQQASIIVSALTANGAPYGEGNTAYTVRLGQNQITPGSIAGWLEATFPGYVTIASGLGWTNGNDSLTLQPTLTLGPPAGGWRWTANSGINTGQTIRSLRVDHASNGTPIGTLNLDSPVSVVLNGDQITIGPIQQIVTPITPV